MLGCCVRETTKNQLVSLLTCMKSIVQSWFAANVFALCFLKSLSTMVPCISSYKLVLRRETVPAVV